MTDSAPEDKGKLSVPVYLSKSYRGIRSITPLSLNFGWMPRKVMQIGQI